MKNIFTAILFLSVSICFGQIKAEQKPFKNIDSIKKYDHSPAGEKSIDSELDYSQIFTSVQVQAVPPGGMNAFRQMIGSTFKLPTVYETTIGTVIAKFVVWDDGSIRDIQIVKETPANLGLGKEAIRVISSSAKWKPGIYNNRDVKQYYTLPISIQIKPSVKTGNPIDELKKDEVQIVNEKVIDAAVSFPEKQAEPIDGLKRFYSDLSSKIQIPEVEVAGLYKTRVKFLVNQDGSLSDFQVVSETPSNVGLGLNVIKYLQGYGNWIPGEQNGRKVKTYFVLPVTLNIEPDIEPEIKKKD
jgi:hypothetical protein